MTPPRGGLKGIYRQRKSGAGGKPKPSPKKKSKNGKPQQCQDAEGYTAEEEQLRQFDMDMSYGPCIGVTRLRRWERAAAMGLCPPPHLRDLILQLRHPHPHDANVVIVGSSSSFPPPPKTKRDTISSVDSQMVECLWAGKV